MAKEEDIETLIKIVEFSGVTERNILELCSEAQIRIWLKYALLGKSEQEIAAELSRSGKHVQLSSVRYALNMAMLNIITSILSDCNIKEWLENHKETRDSIENLILTIKKQRKLRGRGGGVCCDDVDNDKQ